MGVRRADHALYGGHGVWVLLPRARRVPARPDRSRITRAARAPGGLLRPRDSVCRGDDPRRPRPALDRRRRAEHARSRWRVTGQLGRAAGTAALVSEWQTAKVARVALVRHGTEFKGSVTTWLTGLHNPLAMTLVPGPSLLVGDWGTGVIYRLSPRPR